MVSERSSRVIDKHIQRVDIASTHSALHSREEMRHSFGLGISHGRSRNETTVVQHGNKITAAPYSLPVHVCASHTHC